MLINHRTLTAHYYSNLRSKPLLLFLFLFMILMSACSVHRPYPPDAFSIASSHELIAIVPPIVELKKKKKIDVEVYEKQEKAEALNFQLEMYQWFIKRKLDNKFSVEIQDVEFTNTKLKELGYFDGKHLTSAEISEVLEVDALVISNYYLSKPVSVLADIGMRFVFGEGLTNWARLNLRVYDKEKNKLIWMIKHQADGNIYRTPADLVSVLMKGASKWMPYSAKYRDQEL